MPRPRSRRINIRFSTGPLARWEKLNGSARRPAGVRKLRQQVRRKAHAHARRADHEQERPLGLGSAARAQGGRVGCRIPRRKGGDAPVDNGSQDHFARRINKVADQANLP